MTRYWRTESGRVVEERDRTIDERGAVKIACFLVPTGGWFGWLHERRLIPATREGEPIQ